MLSSAPASVAVEAAHRHRRLADAMPLRAWLLSTVSGAAVTIAQVQYWRGERRRRLAGLMEGAPHTMAQ